VAEREREKRRERGETKRERKRKHEDRQQMIEKDTRKGQCRKLLQ
jgi:hypothetical protein